MHTPFLSNRLGRWLAVTLLALMSATTARAQLTGTKAIPADYATVAAAITALNAQGVGAGGVTFNVPAGYSETFASPTAGAITATGTAANPILFQKSGTGANPKITAGVGTTTNLDAIISLSGSDYVTIDGLDVAENAANTTATTQMEFGYALFRPSATDGCQFNTIRNCVVTLNKTNTGTIGIYGAPSTAASATAVAATATSGANTSNRVYGNVVTNSLTGIYFAASSSTTTANYDQNNEIGVTAGNTIGNFGGTATGYAAGGTYQNGLKISGNTINSTLNYTSATASTPIAASTVTSTLRGIYTPAGTSSNIDITNNTITLASGATSSQMSGIENGTGSTAAGNTVNITGNTVTNCTYATATSPIIYCIYNTASAATINISNNTVTANNMGSATTTSVTFYGVYNFGAGTTVNLGSNTVTNNTTAGSGTVALVYGGSPTTLNVTNNIITGNTKTGGATTSGSFYCIQALTTAATVTGNTVNNNSIITAGTISGLLYGYYNLGSPTAETVTQNTFTNLTVGGTSTSTSHAVGGINSNPVSTTVKNFSQNTLGNLTTPAGGIAYGIYTATGATVTLNRNKIYGISAGTSGGVAYGLFIVSGTTVTASNNLIGDITAPASTSLLGVAGLYVGGGTTINAYYNTIQLNANSTGATFGTSGIYLNSTSATLDLRNNIVVNKSAAIGTGAYTAALRRVSGTAGTAPANLATTTNNNLYFVGTPSATNLIYVEGTTTATNAQQTLTAYKALVASRESNSATEDVPFLSTTGTAATFLHINPAIPTQVESAGTPITDITTDFDGDTRNGSTPDLGADEGTFAPLDLTGPSIVFTALGSTSGTANRILSTTITDPSGVSASAVPRLFYRKGTSGAFTSALATSVSGSAYTFTLNYAALGGVVPSDVIQYYVVAQDVPGNVSSSPAGGTFSTIPASFFQYTILTSLNGIYYVGTSTSPDASRTYATLTAAANAYSSSGMSGPVTFLLLDNAYSATTGETFPVIFFNNPDANATNTLLVKPNTGVSPVVTAAGSVLVLAGTRYVTIDGSNGSGTPVGTSRNLTLANTSQTASTYSLGLLTQTGITPSNLFATVRNVNVTGGGITANTTIGILLNGADNDNVTLQNNSVQGVTTGIQAFGTANASAGGLDNLVITGNLVGPATATSGANINQYGIVVGSAISPVLSANEVQNIVNPTTTFASNMTGILLQDVKTGSVTRNSVHNLTYNGTSTAKLYGISTQISTSTFNTAANASTNRFDNNLVYNLNSTASSASWNTSGINNNGGYGDQYYFNTVYLSGQLSTGSAGSAAFSNGNGISATAAANIDVRNNIFSIIGGTGAATTPLYAHYTTLASYAGSTLDYNDLYVTAGAAGVARIGRLNSLDATTLADWRTATSLEAQSISVDPQFVQTTTLPYDLTPGNVALNNVGTPISGVTVDFRNTTRGALPDMGAYEFTPLTSDLAPVALVAPATSSTCYSPTEAVSVSIRNAGTGTLNFSLNPATITVVVTPPSGTTQTLTTTINTGTLASGTAQTVTLPTTLNMTAVGTYSFAITATVTGDGNTSNDQLTPAPTRTVATPVAGTLAPAASAICISGTATLTLTGAANGSIQYQQSGDNVTFTDIAGASSAVYTTPVISATTYYRAQVRCNTGVATSNVSTITVNNPQVATTNTPVSICSGSTATLTATASAGSLVRFFSAATGGTALTTATPGTYTTPALTASTTYYAEAYSGGSERVGPADNTISTGGVTDNYYALVFNVTAPTTLLGVSVFPTAAGITNIQLLNSSGTVLQTYAATFTAADLNVKTFVPLNFPLPTGTGLQLANASTSTASLYRNTAGGVYPYTSPSGTVSITGNTFSSGAAYYYYFYDWSVSSECVGAAARTAVQVNVTQPATASFPNTTASTCGTSAYQLAGTVGGSATGGTYTTSGTGTFSPNATTLTASYTPSAADVTAGSVTITLTSAGSTPCPAATATFTLSISPAPVASFSYPAATTYCAGSTSTVAPTLGTGASAGTFTSTTGLSINATTGVITLASSTADTYTVTNTVAASGTCAAVSATTSVTIAPATSAAFAYATGTFCASGTNPTATVTGTAGGTFSSTTGLSLNASTGAINLSASTLGTYTVTYTVTGACGSSATASVTITAAPVATFSYPAATTYCAGSTSTVAPTLGTGASAGTFTSTTGLSINATTGVITLSTSTAGTYTVTNSITASGSCAAAMATTTVTITPATTATFAYSGATFCASGTNPTATVTGTAGGTFSSTTGLSLNASTGAINLSASTLGTYTVTYTVTGACGSSATASVTITAAPVATFSYPAATTYCAGSTSTVAPTLGTGASAGTFTSTTGLSINATTGVITLSTSTAGTYTVTNSITASGSCAAAMATTTVTITPATTATFAYSGATFCASGTNPTATVTGTAGGTFSSTPGLSLNSSTGAINLSASTLGTYTVTYTVTGACGSSATASVTITAGQVAAFSYGTASTYCVSGTTAPAAVLGTGASAGTFSSTTGLTLNATTGAITLASSTPGTYTVTNTVAAAGGCATATATTTVTITAAPTATFSYGTASTYCVSGTTAPAAVLGTGASAGTFSSTTGLTLNATTGAITLASSTPGTYTVTNTVAAAGGCATATATTTVTITAAPTATFSYGTASTYCVSGTTAPAAVLGTGASAGTFSSTTGLTLNATTGAITLASSTPGTYTVTNTVAAAGGCATATATTTVTITAAPTATFSYATTTGCAGSTTAVTPTLGTGATAGTYASTTGLVINATTGAITLATSTAGTYTVTNTVVAAGGCAAATATATFTVNPRPATPTLSVVYNGTTTTMTSSATTGNQFFLNGVAIAGATGQTYVVNGLPAQYGSYTVVVTNTNGCTSLPSTPLVITAARNGIAGASLQVYPNPTPTGQVTLELTGYRLATQLTVLDALGRVILSELLPANTGTATRTLDLTGVATGVYLLRLRNTDGVETRRLVRE
ncbi:T9SS type A sorting domain-containing protein [Hymenobacter siberiensis]|uniref:T9SS type A sorting domain-containing protein n=1 Tax=Hymenobacter siberiensis TaxID=2848396 RepID=UPI001C1E392A|nr:T9SS type A sorting domain-containing protein [Hymenobacter siberiensis]MBU6119607.1 T9SS type A sorting domain-containing protein [Hymenobacter siberiensis]